MFKVLDRLPVYMYKYYNTENCTFHVKRRISRIALYGSAKIVDAFIVDKGHRNGCEVHMIDAHGVVFVYNKNSRKFVTVLNARPYQIKRYYIESGLTQGVEVTHAIKVADENNRKHGYNNYTEGKI